MEDEIDESRMSCKKLLDKTTVVGKEQSAGCKHMWQGLMGITRHLTAWF